VCEREREEREIREREEKREKSRNRKEREFFDVDPREKFIQLHTHTSDKKR
jgi:hypothetical protein